MKIKSLINVSKRIMTGCLTVAMILTGIVVMPEEAKAATAKAVFYDDEAREYKISDYWTDKKVPVKKDYVFGGWYKAEGESHVPLTEADLENAEKISDYDNIAYAKFVPAEVLSIKTQIGTSTDATTQETITSMRILSTVDSKNYQAVGFAYKLATQLEGTTNDPEKGEITKVYSKIKKSKYDSEMYEPGNEFVSGVSEYFIAADVSKIGSGSFAKIVYARPYWITMDGTKVMGLARNSRVEDKDKDYTSVGINLLPQLVEEEYAAVAAGKIQVKYNTAYYDVQSVDKTTHDTNGGTYLFPEMECHIDEEAGTITFVGNAVIQNGTLTNLEADGLFANVRFAKTEANTNETALTLEITTTEFCNWDEESVTKFIVQ